MKKYTNTIVWVALALIAILLRVVASPETIERVYSRGIFPVIRSSIDALLGWLPFAWVYVLAGFLLLLLVINGVRAIRRRRPWQDRLLRFGRHTLRLVGIAVFLFLVLWGYNYGRIPLEQQIGIEPQPMEVDVLEEELRYVTDKMIGLRQQIPAATDSAIVRLPFLESKLVVGLRRQLELTLAELGYPTDGSVRVRRLRPRGILLRISTAGVYLPWTGEGHVDAGLHPLQLPFVMTHEMSHGYGITDEGSCNFVAYLSCVKSENVHLQYIGYFSYWRYLASNFRRYRPEAYKQFFEEQIPPGIQNDLRAIYREMDKYPDILPAVRDFAYDHYLKAQGIDEGLKNYSRIIMLATAYRRKYELAPHLQTDESKE